MPIRQPPDITRIRQLIAAGLTTKQIRERLGCSRDVVQKQRRVVENAAAVGK